MLSIKMGNRIYELPLGELYRDRFIKYINGDILDLNNVNDSDKYQVYDSIFDFVAKSFTMIYGVMEEEGSFKYKKVSEDIRRRIDPVDRIQKFYIKNGQVDKSIKTISVFVEEMLKFNEMVKEEENRKVKNR